MTKHQPQLGFLVRTHLSRHCGERDKQRRWHEEVMSSSVPYLAQCPSKPKVMCVGSPLHCPLASNTPPPPPHPQPHPATHQFNCTTEAQTQDESCQTKLLQTSDGVGLRQPLRDPLVLTLLTVQTSRV